MTDTIIRTKINTEMKIILFILAFCPAIAFAHGDEKHEKKKNKPKQDTSIVEKIKEDIKPPSSDVDFSMKGFPTMHPLVVHFPIVLLLLGPLFQLLSLFWFKREFSLITLFTVLFGFIGAWLASKNFHPHTTDLTAGAQQVLEQHEYFASIALWASGTALLLKLISHFPLKRKMIGEVVVLITLIIAGVAVSISGHHGAQLTHMHGVGPQGKYLEMEHNEHNMNEKPHKH